jgi:hypothetical protein
MSLPQPGPGPGTGIDVGKVLGYLGGVALIVAVVVLAWTLFVDGSDGEGSGCAEVPGTAFIACRTSDMPKDWRDRNCVPSLGGRRVTVWNCPD